MTRSELQRRVGFSTVVPAGILAGVLAWGVIEPFYNIIPLPEKLTEEVKGGGFNLPPELKQRLDAARLKQRYLNTSLSVALFGLAAGCIFGAAQGLAAKGRSGAGGGAGRGALAGVVAGAIGGLAAVAVESSFPQLSKSQIMYRAMAVHATAWVLVAAGIALAMALTAEGAKSFGRKFAPLAAGGMLAALVFPVLSSLVFPDDRLEQPVPTGMGNRLLWTTLTTTLMALLVGKSLAPDDVATRGAEQGDS